MRHPKRWQDVVELLDAGINVYTTLNVQHLESVNDIVERITGVRVRETLPDSVLEQADEVELVDIAPEELLERFREGKVYRPDQAERAAKHFFTKGNLIALRETGAADDRAARRCADAGLPPRRAACGTSSAHRARARLRRPQPDVAAAGPFGAAAGRQPARRSWIAAYVETPTAARLSEKDRRRVEQNLRLAEELGAQTVTLERAKRRRRGDRLRDSAQRHQDRHRQAGAVALARCAVRLGRR